MGNASLSEVHIVAERSFFTKIRKGFYTFNVNLPEYAQNDLYWYKQHIKFYFYKKKTGKPYLVGHFCNGTYSLLNPSSCTITIRKLPLDTEPNITSSITKWSYKYGVPMRIGKQNYYVNGFRPIAEGLNCGLDRMKEIRRALPYTVDHKMKYWHFKGMVDELTEYYENNLKRIFEGARIKGMTYLYIGDMTIATVPRPEEERKSFDSWISSISDIVGGMGSGGGNSNCMCYGDITYLITPQQANKVYNVWTEKEITAKRILNQFDNTRMGLRRGGVGSDWIRESNDLYAKYQALMETKSMPMRRTEKIPEKALDLYNEYLDVRDKYFSKVGEYLYEEGYRVVETKWRTDFEGMVFVTEDYGSVCKIKVNENSDQIKGPWVYGLKKGPLLQVHCEDKDVEKILKELPFNIGPTFAKKMLDLLEEVRYISMADKTLARLKGED